MVTVLDSVAILHQASITHVVQTAPLLNYVKPRPKVAYGAGFGGNTKTGKYQYGAQLPYLKITRDADGFCVMENKAVMVITMDHHYSALKRPITFPCPTVPGSPQDFFYTGQQADGYDEFNGAFSPSNDALYAATVLQNMFAVWYHLPVLTKRDGTTPMQLTLRVHYGNDYASAYWDGKQTTFGDGNDILYPLVSLGIIAHEISHGFTQQHSNLTYWGEPAGINEAFSDMTAQAAMYYSTGKNNWQVGSEILKQESSSNALRFDIMRYMDRPSKDGVSYDTATQYYTAFKKDPSSIKVHSTTGVFNRLFYVLATLPDWNVHRAFDVMVTANRYYWGPYDTFMDAGCGVMYAAKDLGYSVDAIKQSLATVEIDYALCA